MLLIGHLYLIWISSFESTCTWFTFDFHTIGKSILQVPDTSTRVLDNTRPFLRSSIEGFRIKPACSKERKYHIFRQYWYTRNVPVFINTGTFQYLGPQVYFFHTIYLRFYPHRFLLFERKFVWFLLHSWNWHLLGIVLNYFGWLLVVLGGWKKKKSKKSF